MGIMRKGLFFSLDALLGLLIIFLIILIAIPATKNSSLESQIDRDILVSMSSIEIGEFNNVYVKNLISSGLINKLNESILETIGGLYVSNPNEAKQIANEFFSTIKTKENVGIWIENSFISSKNSTRFEDAQRVDTSRQIISGISLGQNITGYAARAFFSSNVKTSYSYFGGYVGDGNVTLTAEYNGTITDADLELATNKDFDLYINGDHAGNYSKSPSTTSPETYDLSSHIDKFNSGINRIELSADRLYVAGGFLKIKYESEPVFTTKKQYFSGVYGLINIYDGFYLPSTPSSMEINLDLESNFTTFLNLGNKTIFNRTTNGRENIVLDNSSLSAILNYSELSNKTTPIRLGLRNVSFIYDKKLDVISVIDLSGSMDDNCPGGTADPGETPCKINDAKNATDELINAILNTSGNKIGLAGFETYAKKSDFHNLSNSSSSLKNVVNNNWNADGYTCICCGILKAISCFEKKVFYENFSNQSAGSNPISWTLSESGGSIDITSNSIEGIRSAQVARTGSQNPYMQHIIAPQEDPLNIEFLVRHDTGAGRFRLEIEAKDSSETYRDYIILKMYGGAIRNNDANVTNYTLNQTYKIRVELTPGASKYNLYVNDTLAGSSLTSTGTYSNIARLRFTTETAAINYKIDSINISLQNYLCTQEANRTREMIVMSDGEANRDCGLEPAPNWDGDGDTTADPQDQAIEAACLAKNIYGMTVHAIAFDIANGSLAEQTMQGIASCGGGGFYVSNSTQLSQTYRDITKNIFATFTAQSFNTTATQKTRLYPNSYISLSYPELSNPFGMAITVEQPFSNSSSVNFSIPDQSIPISLTAISYSGSLWTKIVKLNNEVVYNLSKHGTNYLELGDPYAIKIDPGKLNKNNTLYLSIASSATANETNSSNNKVIYTIIKNVSSYSQISPIREGCEWLVFFEDNTNLTFRVPQNYSGLNQCSYTPSSTAYSSNDALQSAVYNLLTQLDIDLDKKLDLIFGPNEVTIDVSEVQGIPYPWSTEIQIRRWI